MLLYTCQNQPCLLQFMKTEGCIKESCIHPETRQLFKILQKRNMALNVDVYIPELTMFSTYHEE